jgi:DUF4097 and DUF4098 domain-containing protein YvlB
MNFELEGNTFELDLILSKSGIEIIEMERGDIEVSFSDLRKKTAEEIFSANFRHNKLTVKELSKSRSSLLSSFFDNDRDTDVTIKVPTGSVMTGLISTVSGDIQSRRLTFSGDIKTINGKIVFGEIVSRLLKLQVISGDIVMDDFRGALSGNVVGGRVAIHDGELSDLSLKCVTSDVSITTAFDLEKRGCVSTVSGNIDLHIKRYQGDNALYLSTLSGAADVNGNYPEHRIEVKKRMPFLNNNPFETVKPMMRNLFSSVFSMSDGENIEIKTRSDGERSDNIKSVLEMLSAKKITPEEAERLINALSRNR